MGVVTSQLPPFSDCLKRKKFLPPILVAITLAVKALKKFKTLNTHFY